MTTERRCPHDSVSIASAVTARCNAGVLIPRKLVLLFPVLRRSSSQCRVSVASSALEWITVLRVMTATPMPPASICRPLMPVTATQVLLELMDSVVMVSRLPSLFLVHQGPPGLGSWIHVFCLLHLGYQAN